MIIQNEHCNGKGWAEFKAEIPAWAKFPSFVLKSGCSGLRESKLPWGCVSVENPIRVHNI